MCQISRFGNRPQEGQAPVAGPSLECRFCQPAPGTERLCAPLDTIQKGGSPDPKGRLTGSEGVGTFARFPGCLVGVSLMSQGVPAMCDYSLHNVPARPAQVGDKIVTTTFRNTTTRGFAAVESTSVAVCLVPGTELAFEQEIEYDPVLPFLRKRKAGSSL